MSSFSEQFRAAVESSGVTVAELAKYSGISISMLYKIQSGTRLPDSRETLERLLDNLLCSISQRRELLRAYQVERIGVLRYESFQELKGLIGDVADLIPTVKDPTLRIPETELPGAITGVRNVNAAVMTLLGQECRRDGGQIDMMVPQRYVYCFECLSQVLADPHPGFRGVRHLFSLQSSGTDEAVLENMRAIRQLLPRMFNLPGYYPWYCYLPDPDNGVTPFPYLIITSAGVLLLSGSLHAAVFLKDPEVRELYSRAFQQRIGHYTPVLRTVPGSLTDYMGVYTEILQRVGHQPQGVCVAIAPGVLPFLPLERLVPYIPEEVRQSPLLQEGMAWIRDMQQGAKTFFTLDGLRQAVEGGKIVELLGADIPKIRREDMLAALERFTQEAKAGHVTPCLFREDIFQGSSRISLGLYDNVLHTGCEMADGQAVFTDLTEATLARVLRDYTEHAILLGDVYSPEESIALLERELRRYRNIK